MMIPILLCSIIAVGIIIGKWRELRRTQRGSQLLILKMKNILASGTIEEAIRYCEQSRDLTAHLMIEGLKRSRASRAEINDALEKAGRDELFKLEKYIPTLATIAGLAPLLGFLGTVTGMVNAFMTIQQLGGNVNASVLAGGIWEALITTVAGLIVGIIALIFYNHFTAKIQQIAHELSNISFELNEFISQLAPKR